MFAGLDHVQWSALTYAYSGEADIPALFRSLLDEKAAPKASSTLLNELYHQGGFVCSAAVAALPFLVEAAESPRVPRRGRVLGIVEALARTSLEVAPRWVAPGWQDAWTAAAPRLFALLDDGDAEVRRAVTSVLRSDVRHADEIVTAFRARWSSQDLETRLEQILAVGALAGSLTVAILPETLIWFRELIHDPDEQVALAAALALRDALPGRPTEVEPIATGLEGDLTVWSATEPAAHTAASTVRWAIDRLDDDLDAREKLCLALLDHHDADRRRGAMWSAANLLSISRRPRRLTAALRDHTTDPDIETRIQALHLLAANAGPGGQDADLFADRLSDRAHVQGRRASYLPPTADVALWGLVWSGDERCMPRLVERISGDPAGFALHDGHSGKGIYSVALPSLRRLLLPCSAWGETLLPAILERLHPNVEMHLGRTLLQVLTAWGHPSAVPVATELLSGQLRQWASEVLGALGPEAAAAEPALRRLLDDPGAGLDHPTARSAAVISIPWAYWRITGDPQPALDALLPRLGQSRAVRHLADLGPEAAECVPSLRLRSEASDPWTALETAHALIRITGEIDQGMHVLMRPVFDLLDGTPMPVAMSASRYLAEVGGLSRGYISTIEAVLADDRRHSWDGGWAAIHDDLEVRRHLRSALLHQSG